MYALNMYLHIPYLPPSNPGESARLLCTRTCVEYYQSDGFVQIFLQNDFVDFSCEVRVRQRWKV